MLRQLHIKNFKGWKDTQPIRMAPITLFFGTNSSGKSSIGHFLMMLKQTTASADRSVVFNMGNRDTPVNLGSYEEMMYGRDLKNKISFLYSWELPVPLSIRDPLSDDSFALNAASFEAEVSGNDSRQPIVDFFRYDLTGDGNGLDISLTRNSKGAYVVGSKKYKFIRRQMRAWPLQNTVRFYGFPDEATAYYQNADFVQSLNLEQEKLFRSIHYLGPLREKAERLYTWGGASPESVGFSGENTVAALLASDNRKINFGRKYKNRGLSETIAVELKNMNLIEDFQIKQIAKGRPQYELKILTKASKKSVDLPDVGVGISQVLPVLTQCYYAEPGSIIIMEQPEIHLHPSAQADLADVMIRVINSQENGNARNIQLIIETHSEHFLRRLQRRVAEGALGEEQIAAYFAHMIRTESQLDDLKIDEYGNIKNWPENFFGDEMGDITGQTKAALLKRKRNREDAK